jgi:hypothetical protein
LTTPLLRISAQWVFAGQSKPTLRSWFNAEIRAKADLSKFSRRLHSNSSPPENPTEASGGLHLRVPIPRTLYGRSPCEDVVVSLTTYFFDEKTHRCHLSFSKFLVIGHCLRVALPAIAESGGCRSKSLRRVRFPASSIFRQGNAFANARSTNRGITQKQFLGVVLAGWPRL